VILKAGNSVTAVLQSRGLTKFNFMRQFPRESRMRCYAITMPLLLLPIAIVLFQNSCANRPQNKVHSIWRVPSSLSFYLNLTSKFNDDVFISVCSPLLQGSRHAPKQISFQFIANEIDKFNTLTLTYSRYKARSYDNLSINLCWLLGCLDWSW
jgi:hypothetical protein